MGNFLGENLLISDPFQGEFFREGPGGFTDWRGVPSRKKRSTLIDNLHVRLTSSLG